MKGGEALRNSALTRQLSKGGGVLMSVGKAGGKKAIGSVGQLFSGATKERDENGRLVLHRVRPTVKREKPMDGYTFDELPGVEITPEQYGELRDLFAYFDWDGSGMLDEEEMEAALSMLGIANSESECKELMAMIDVDGDNVVSWEEFLGFGALLLNNAMLLQRELDLAFEVRRPVMAC